MKHIEYKRFVAVLLVLTVAGMAASLATRKVRAQNDDDGGRAHQFRAELRGRHEVPLTLSGGHGNLALTVKEGDSSVHFVLTYEGLRTHILFSHIHVGQPNVNGGVTVFFCDNTKLNHPQACPEGAGTVEGDFGATDVIGLTSQQLAAADLAALLEAIRARQTYANLHTMDSPGGEIRGQILPGRE